MKVLLVHNFYREPGGEDLVYADEGRMLESRGHEVIRYTADNDEISGLSTLALAGRTLWSRRSYQAVRQLIARERPQVAHVHNTFPLISPSVYYAARAEGVPVVQTLHNYRLICPAAVCFRDGAVCTDCLGRAVCWPGVRHACYRGSHTESAAVATMLAVHRLAGSWQRKVSVYVALTELALGMFVEAGLPASKFVVKPNFVDPDPGPGSGSGGYALFVGRLSVEKGVRTLLNAWRLVEGSVPLLVVGDGPLAPDVKTASESVRGITWLGRRGPGEIHSLLRDAACLVFPSECYETFGRVIVEAFAAATPVIAARHGAAAELVRDGITGLHFRPGDSQDLAGKVRRLGADPSARRRLGAAARRDFETRYTSDVNYRSLLDIYQCAIDGGDVTEIGDRAR
jgi:glycosyltransferase involved in cell wall biosynthesis